MTPFRLHNGEHNVSLDFKDKDQVLKIICACWKINIIFKYV